MDLAALEPPEHLDWQKWVERWDRMQERYVSQRDERFEIVLHAVAETQPSIASILDLGCGTGSLMLTMLEAFPEARVVGIEFDPTMVWLAGARLERFGERARVARADLREASWTEALSEPVDAAVSATALHWLSADQLAGVYAQLGKVMRPRGIFLNADHVGSNAPRIQSWWEHQRARLRTERGADEVEDWDGFWNAYSEALGLDAHEIQQRVVGAWEAGIEEGLPLAWHFDSLRASGFAQVDCFWRCDCDAIYGGIRSDGKS
jgi:SAM-dependent methyltransferase